MKKRLLRIGIAILLFFLAVFVLLHTPPIQKQVRKYAVKRLEKDMGLKLTVRDLDFNLLSLGISLYDVTVQARDQNGLPPFLKADSIRAKIPLSLLTRGNPEIKELSASHLRITIYRSMDQRTNIPGLRSSSKKKENQSTAETLPEFRLGKLTLSDASILYVDDRHDFSVESPPLDIKLNWIQETRHSFLIESRKEGKLIYKKEPMLFHDLLAKGILCRDFLEIQNLAVDLAQNRIELSGRIDGLLSPHMDLKMNAGIGLKSLRPLWPESAELSGTINASTRLEGPVSTLQAKMHLQGQNLRWGQIRDAGLEADLQWKEQTLSASSLLIEWAGGRLTGRGEIHPLDWEMGNRALIEWQDLDLLTLSSLFGSFPSFVSKVSGNAEVSWDKFDRAGITAKTDLILQKPVSVKSSTASLPYLTGRLHAELSSKQASVLIHELLTENLSLSGNIHMKGRNLSGQYSLGTKDLRSLGFKYFPSAILEKLPDLGGSLTISGRIEGTTRAPRVYSQWAGNGISFLGWSGMDLTGEADWEKRSIRVRYLRLTSGSSTMNFSGHYPLDLKSSEPSIDFTVDGLSLEAVSSLFELGEKIEGQLELAGHIRQIYPFPRISGKGKLKDIEYSGWKLNQASLEYKLEERKLFIAAAVSSPALSLEGDIGLDTPFNFTVSIKMDDTPLSDIEPFIPALPLTGISGEISARLNFKGDFQSLSRTDISGSVKVEKAGFGISEPRFNARDVRFELALDRGEVEIKSSHAQLDNGILEIEGRLPLSILMSSSSSKINQEKPGRINMRIDKLDPFVLISAFQSRIPSELTGFLEGNVEMTIPALELEAVAAEASIESFDLDLGGIPLELEKPPSLHLKTGKLILDEMSFRGKGHSLRLGGILDLTGKEFRAFFAEGNVDLIMYQSFLDDVALSGNGQFKARIEGPFINPSITGAMNFQDVRVELSQPDLYLTGFSGEIRFSDKQIDFSGLEGGLNGGKFTLAGTINLNKFAIEKASLKFSGDEINMDYPSGLRSLLKAQLVFESDGARHVLSGGVSLLFAEYQEPFNVQSRLFQLLRTKGRGIILLERNEFLNNLNFDIRIDTINLAEIDNNLAKAAARVNLKLTGSPYNPGLSGRVEFNEGGEVYLTKNTYQIEQASLDFINPTQIVPDINLRAQTRVSGYLVQLLVFGTPDDLSAKLLSDPPLAEADIVSLLLTGRRLEYVSSSLLNVVTQQALDYLEGAVLGQVERIAEKTLGLDSVRIDTSLIASQENPEGRITVGQQITSELGLIFSQGLRDTDERTIILNYHPLKNLNMRGIKQDNDAYQLSAMHEIRFGLKRDELIGPDYPVERKGVPIEKVEFQGQMGIPAENIARKLKLKAGKRFDFFYFQKDLEQIRKLYLESNYLEFKIDYQKLTSEGKVTLIYRLAAGPKVILRISGAEVSRRTIIEAKRTWMEGAFPRKRVEDVQRLIRNKFIKRGYYRIKILVEEEAVSPESKTIHLRIFPVVRYTDISFHFEGRKGLAEQNLIAILDKPDSLSSLFSKPGDLIKEMESIYRQNGYLKAKMEIPRIDFRTAEKAADVYFPIREGPLFVISRVEFRGRSIMDRKTLLSAVGISEDDPFTLEAFYRSHSRLEDLYAGQGFLNASIQSRIEIDPDEGKVGLIFDIEENKKAIIEEIRILGNKITAADVIKRELDFEKGQAVDYRRFSKAQKKLYGLGIFNSIRIDAYPENTEQDPKDTVPFDQSYRVEVSVEEMKPYHLRYGAQYNTETGIGGEAELVRRNFLGRAMDLGGNIQVNLREQDARAFIRTPYFLGNRMDTSLFAFANRKEEPDFITSRIGTTLQQQIAIHNEFIISYNYTFEHLRNLFGDIPVPDERYNIGRLTLSLSRDRRKNIFDSPQGNFISVTGEYAEKILASDVRYLRIFGQYFIYRPLGRFLTYAAAVRLGLGRGLGQELVSSERFFAGGSSSLRGFGYHEVGPKNPITGNPEGGNAVFILNQELRFPIYKILKGVVFLDAGNVYSSISDFDPLDIRKTAGFGIRLNLGFALARLDMGFKLDRREGESAFRLHFSLGQAF